MNGDPLDGASWIEHELTRLTWPINAQPIDLDRDGDRDIVGRSVVWLEQPASPGGQWTLHEIGQYGPDDVVGLSVADVNGDGRPDVMTGGSSGGARNADADANATAAAGRLACFEHPRIAAEEDRLHAEPIA